MDDLQKSRRCTVSVERLRVSQQLKKHDAGGENIGSRIDRLSIYLLRRHISQAADELTGASDGLIPDVSNSEVHDFHAAGLWCTMTLPCLMSQQYVWEPGTRT